MAGLSYRTSVCWRPSLAAVVFVAWPLRLAGNALAQGIPPQQPPVANGQRQGISDPTAQKPASLPPDIAKAAKAFSMALEHQQAGRNAQAIAEYREVVRLAPNVYPAHMNLGLLYRAEGKLDLAEQSLKRASGLDPKNPTPLTQLAFVHLAQKRFPDAKTAAAKAVTLDARNPQCHYALGAACAGLKDLAGAERGYREAARLAPRNVEFQIAYASTLGALKRYAEAMDVVEAALKLEPKSYSAHMYRGMLLQTDKNFPAAVMAYKRAAELDPSSAAPWYNMGMCYQILAKEKNSIPSAQEAITAYLRAVELAPKYLPAYQNLGRLYFHVGNYRQAARHFDRAAALDPRSAQTQADAAVAEFWVGQMSRDPKERADYHERAENRYRMALQKSSDAPLFAGLGHLYEQTARLDKAVTVYQQWTQKQPGSAAPWLSLAKALESQKKSADAQRAYEKALTAEPKNTEATSNARMALALLMENQNKLDSAASHYLLALKVDPKNNEARRKLGQVYLRQKKTEDALAQFQEMKKVAPKESAPYLAIASLYEGEKKFAEAEREYRAMSALNPKDTVAHWYVARTLEAQKKYLEAVEEYRDRQDRADRHVLRDQYPAASGAGRKAGRGAGGVRATGQGPAQERPVPVGLRCRAGEA
jgi:tetratricopeptide (TPR) repeat protein